MCGGRQVFWLGAPSSAAFPARGPVALRRGASPLTAAGPSRSRTGFPYRSPIRASLSSSPDEETSALGPGRRVGGGHLRAFVDSVALVGSRHVGRGAAEGGPPHRVRDPRRAAPACIRPVAAGPPDRDRLRRVGRDPPA